MRGVTREGGRQIDGGEASLYREEDLKRLAGFRLIAGCLSLDEVRRLARGMPQ